MKGKRTNCPVCGKVFKKKKVDQKTCSLSCKRVNDADGQLTKTKREFPIGKKIDSWLVISEPYFYQIASQRISCTNVKCLNCGEEKRAKISVLRWRKLGCYNCSLRTQNGLSRTRLYAIWSGMHKRCYSPRHTSFEKYHREGITVCEEWHDFMNFREWSLANGYEENLTIDRKDNTKGYYPENCKWSTQAEQVQNRRCVKMNPEKVREIRRLYSNGGITQLDLAEKFNCSAHIIYCIVKRRTWKNV